MSLPWLPPGELWTIWDYFAVLIFAREQSSIQSSTFGRATMDAVRKSDDNSAASDDGEEARGSSRRQEEQGGSQATAGGGDLRRSSGSDLLPDNAFVPGTKFTVEQVRRAMEFLESPQGSMFLALSNGPMSNGQGAGYGYNFQPFGAPPGWVMPLRSRKVEYMSGDDDDERRGKKGITKSRRSRTSDSDDERKESKGKRSGGKGESSKSPKKTPKRKIVFVNKIKDLGPLGKFDKLDSTDDAYKLIAKYVAKSHNLPESKGKVKIHDIYKVKDDKEKKSGASPASSGSTPKTSGGGGKKGGPHKMMLWFKTTPDSVKRLAEKKDACIAFYDRLARAFAAPPEELKEPLRQFVIVCDVSLGNVKKSPHGYQHWLKKRYPAAECDTVKAIGRLTPDWKANEEEGGSVVPCGKTVKHEGFDNYEVDYSEYIVYEARRVKVKYAVDVEVTPEVEGGSNESEENED